MDSCEVFVIVSKKDSNIRYIKHKGIHSMIKLNDGKIFPSAEWLNFSNTKLHITNDLTE